jgi:hypothetical protein
VRAGAFSRPVRRLTVVADARAQPGVGSDASRRELVVVPLAGESELPKDSEIRGQ